ncbi:MAG: hydroxymethylbilane synthase [Actinomycetota bacterium]
MHLRVGTRRSRLALAQAEEVATLLRALGHEIELVPMSTAGDRGASPISSPSGGKGLFVGDITEALLRGDIDAAVHSAKDLPSEDPPGSVIAAVPLRGKPNDVLVSREAELDPSAVIGTSSLRRRAQLLRSQPGLKVVDMRGNVDTRLRRMGEGRVDALALAAAGLERLRLEPEHVTSLAVDEMVPAPGQGALAVQAAQALPAADAVSAIDHPESREAFEAERELVALLGGGCRLPLGAYAERQEGILRLLAVVIRPDGSDLLWSAVQAETPHEAAGQAAEVLRAAGAAEILAEVAE